MEFSLIAFHQGHPLTLTSAIGFFINYGASLHMAATRTQYRLVQAIPLIPTGIALGLSFLCPETPRYLASKQLHKEGKEVLARLRGKSVDDESLVTEFEEIDAQVTERADLKSISHWAAFKESQKNPNYRQRFWLLMTMQTIAQWTGGNGITYYVSNIFKVCPRPRPCCKEVHHANHDIVRWCHRRG